MTDARTENTVHIKKPEGGRKSLVRKLTIGFRLFVVFFVVCMTLSGWFVLKGMNAARESLHVLHPQDDAIMEIEINMGEMALAVFDFLSTGNQSAVEKYNDSVRDVEQSMEIFTTQFEKTEHSETVDSLTIFLSRCIQSGGRVIDVGIHRSASRELFKESYIAADRFADTAPNSIARDKVSKVRSAIEKVFSAVRNYYHIMGPQYTQEYHAEQTNFVEAIAICRDTDLHDGEESWLIGAEDTFAHLVECADSFVGIMDEQVRTVRQFREHLLRVDQILDEDVQPVVHKRAISSLNLSLRTIKVMLAAVLAISISFLCVIWLVFGRSVDGISRSILKLTDGVNHLASGDLNYRIPMDSKDELGDLATEFNRMAEKRMKAESDLIVSISKQRLVEASLRKMGVRYGAILDTVPDIIMEVDEDKRYTWANDAGLAFFGDDVVGKLAEEYFIGEQNTLEVVEPLFAGDENTIYLESRQRRMDGEERLLAWWCRITKDSDDLVIGGLSGARDITDQRRIEESLVHSEGLFRAITENTADLTVVIGEDGKFTYVSPAVEKLGGFEQAAVRGKPVSDFVHPEDMEAVTEMIARATQQVDHTLPVEPFRARKLDGQYRWLAGSITGMQDEPGVNGIVVNLKDISERREVEQEKDRLFAIMRERVKELTCLYKITNLIRERRSLDSLFHDVLDAIPSAWRYPDIARVRILFRESQYVSESFDETEWSISENLVANGTRVGKLEVFYLEKRRQLRDGPFLSEEVRLLKWIAGILSEAIERIYLEEEVLEISEREKKRIGQDLHDDLCQELKSTEYMLTVLARKLAMQNLSESGDAEKIATMINQAVGHARDLARGLFPVELSESGLEAILSSLTKHISDVYNLECRLEWSDPGVVLSDESALQFYRIAQEALANAVRHGKPVLVTVRFDKKGDKVNLTVSNDCLSGDSDGTFVRGTGLRIMEYRTNTIGGLLMAGPVSPGKWVVSCIVPIKNLEKGIAV